MKNTIFFLLVIIISSSCTERIDNLKLDSSVRRLVVEGIITNESKAHQVKLSYTSDYFSDEPSPPATGATVLLMYNNQILELEETIPGCYFTPDSFRGRPGVKYELNILGIDADEDGVNDEFTAENYLYPVTNIDSFHVMAREVW